ncbi:MAG: hypothetical protein J7501_12575, partial [Bdellovibrio sp.]|nr:hypothetical protein [Bdellovibrio sp.]
MELIKKQLLLMILIVGGLSSPLMGHAAPQSTPKGLFEEDSLLELEIQSDFPYRSYKGHEEKEENSPELFPEYEGKIFVKGLPESIPVKIKARGMSKLYL